MANVYGDRIQETSATSGLTNFTLAGAVSGYRAFSSELGNGDTCSYLAISGTQWEVGIGTYNAGVLERTTVQSSSTGGAAVSFTSAPNLLNTWSAADAASVASPVFPQSGIRITADDGSIWDLILTIQGDIAVLVPTYVSGP